MKILFISLGCDKNLVDTEVMLGLLASRGYEMTDDEQEWAIRQSQMIYTMKYALIFISSAPLLIIYPFVQKHFVKGVMIGAIKG